MKLVKETKSKLKQKNLQPIKHFGQNFLVSEEIIKRIIIEAKIKSGENILEVGPGTGNLTMALLEAGANIIAIEKDDNLTELLKLKSQNYPSTKLGASKLKIIEGDILKFDEKILKSPYRIIANIPYYLTGKLIQKFLLSTNKPSELILMVQKEVGERITAQPPKANYLSSLIQFMAETEILFKVGKENFWPQPKVDSVIIRLTPYLCVPSLRSYAHDTFRVGTKDNEFKGNEFSEFIEFLRKAFKQPRQTLFNNLKKTNSAKPDELENIFNELKFDKKIRAQNLDIKTLKALYEKIMTNA
ncbi:MAG: 16S rRNA (adenine(1518)-N(6)/adenine(1519)-N(6))-dimethyltransferase RsmA [Patescibacteria group bacterium]